MLRQGDMFYLTTILQPICTTIARSEFLVKSTHVKNVKKYLMIFLKKIKQMIHVFHRVNINTVLYRPMACIIPEEQEQNFNTNKKVLTAINLDWNLSMN